MYKNKIGLTAFVSVLSMMLMFSVMTGSALIYTVGVKAGDWAAYGDITFEYASNMPGYEEPPSGINLSWTGIEILDVSGSNVTGRSTAIYANGTEEAFMMSGNLATGEGNFSVAIIPSNLGADDEIPANLTWYTEEPLKVTINGTVTRSYAGAHREVNYANITYPIIHGNITYGYMNMSFYWDKQTGIICEESMSYAMSFTDNSTQYYMNMSIRDEMTATNMWPAVFTIDWEGHAFNVTAASNSTVLNFSFSQPDMEINFNVTGPMGRAGYCNVTVPKDLLRGSPWTILLNNTDWTSSCTITENDTHTFIYIPYTHSTSTIQIIGTWVVPEFPSLLIPPLFMVATLLVIVIYRTRISKKMK